MRSEFIKLCLVHAFRAIRVGELFEIGFPLMNGSGQLWVTVGCGSSTRLNRAAPPSREASPREPAFSLKMNPWLSKNNSEAGVLRNLNSANQGSDPASSEYAALRPPPRLLGLFPFL